MGTVRSVWFAVALTLGMVATPALAQQWVDPQGLVVIDYGPAWRSITPQTANVEVLAAFQSTDGVGRLLCNVRRRVVPAPAPLDQPAANRWLRDFTTMPAQASDRSEEELNGVLYVSFALRSERFDGQYRAFATPMGNEVARTELLCAAPAPLGADDADAINRFFSAVQITPRAER